MGSLRRFTCAFVLLLPALGGIRASGAPDPQPPADPNAPIIQVAILLDTSGSMSGLINQAKTELWNIVNQFASARKAGRAPELQVALYEYGNDGLPADKGYIRQILPLTTDLDSVSEKLFALTTNGGSEYCGQVIQVATQDLQWVDSPSVVKAMFCAGNEPFTQGTVDFHGSCTAAKQKGIVVNTIFCGNSAEGLRTAWKDGADVGGGTYMSIDHNAQAMVVAAPQDKEITTLVASLNSTYVPYGQLGTKGQARQVAQDANAAANNQLAARAGTRAQSFYQNASWDLVDAVNQKQVKLEEVKDADLPEAMRKMNVEQRRAFITEQAANRGRIQARINTLSAERDRYIAAQTRNQAGQNTLGEAVVNAVRSQAVRQGWAFEK